MSNFEKKGITQQTWFVVVMIILFFPVGLFFMWKNQMWNKTARIIVSVVFGVLLAGAMASPDTEVTTDSDKVVAEEQEKEKPKEEKEKPVEKPVELTLDSIVKEKVEDTRDSKLENGILTINITLSDNLTNNFIRSGAYSDAYDICRVINENGKYVGDINTYNFIFFTTFVDKHGNEYDGEALKLSFAKEDIEKVNWVNMYPDKFIELSIDTFIHPALRDKK